MLWEAGLQRVWFVQNHKKAQPLHTENRGLISKLHLTSSTAARPDSGKSFGPSLFIGLLYEYQLPCLVVIIPCTEDCPNSYLSTYSQSKNVINEFNWISLVT